VSTNSIRDYRTQSVFFGSLKSIWLSKIPLNERQEKFPDALEQIPPKLVTTSTFCNVFYPQLTSGIKGNLDGERSWFGIRSILKGGVLAFKHGGNYSKKDLRQLGELEQDQIPRSHTKEHFSDEELKSLLTIYDEYQKWLKKEGFYDDIDLVIRAVRNESGENARLQQEKDNKFNLSLTTSADKRRNVMNKMRLNDDSVVFKKPAQKELQKLEKQQDNLKLIYNWINRNILSKKPFRKAQVEEIDNRLVDYTGTGVPIYKSCLSGGGRVFWTPIKKGKNCTIIIYDFCTTKEKQDPRLSKILTDYKYSNVDEYDDENYDEEKDNQFEKARVSDFEIDDTPCEGPVRPWPHSVKTGFGLTSKINSDSNIQLDELQRGAILSNQPLLIDGLAGTGKTSVLSYRAVVRCAVSKENTCILVTASKDHVVQRISDSMLEIKENGDWEGNQFAMRYELGPGISNEKIPTMDLAKFSQKIPSVGFDEIVLDESQDITAIEFEMLKRLLIGHNLRRLVFAGDPLQTLNPTGFDWNRIRAMFEDGGVNRNDIKVEKFYNNYRSQRKIVEFANAIQFKRGELFGDKSRTVMQAKRGGTEKIRFIRYNLEKDNHMQAIGDIIKNAGESKAIVITSAPDDTGIKDLLSGNSLSVTKDPVMQHVWQNKVISSVEEIDASNFRKELYIHSSSSVKGAEYDVVVLYRFASSESARESLVSLLQEWNEMGKVEKENGIKIRYEYSKLYVALTRAFSRIYLIEDTEGYEFWQKVNLYDYGEVLTDIGTFIDFKEYLDPLKSVNSEDLRPEIEANRENYNEERNKFLKDPTNVIALEYAIGLGKRLLNKEKDLEIEKQLDDLQGEYAWYQSREPQRSEKEKSRLLEKALNFFTKAKSYDKAGPIYYSSKKFEKCLTNLQDFPGEFYKFITLLCQINLNKEIKLSLDESLQLLEPNIQPNSTWAKINPMDEGRLRLKKWIVENHNSKQMMENHSKTKAYFTITELLDEFQVPSEVIHILETFEQTSTSAWMSIYRENVIKLLRAEKSHENKNRIYYEKWGNLSKTQKGDSELKALRKEIDVGLLKNLPKAKNPSTNFDNILSSLRNHATIAKDPMEIENLQTRGMFIARRISLEANDLGIFDVLLEAFEKNEKESTVLFEASEITRKLLEIIQEKKLKHKFPDQVNLSWLNDSNYMSVFDSYLQKSFKESISVNYRNKNPSTVWKEQIVSRMGKKRTKKAAVNEAAEGKKEFKVWFETYYQYSFATNFSAIVEENLKQLFEWTDFDGFDLQEEGKSCFATLIQNRKANPPLYDCERRFIERYLNGDSTQVTLNEWNSLEKLKDIGISRLVKKIRWERDSARFMLDLNKVNFEVSDQEKLSEYIKLLRDNAFDEEANNVGKRVVLNEDEVSKTLDELWEKKNIEEYFNIRGEYASKGRNLPPLPDIGFEVFDDNDDWFKEHGLGNCYFEKSPRDPKTKVEKILFDLLYSNGFEKWFQTLFNDAPRLTETGKEDDYENSLLILGELSEYFTPDPSPKKKIEFRSIEDSCGKLIAFIQVMGICKIPPNFIPHQSTSRGKIQEIKQMYGKGKAFFKPKSLEEIKTRIENMSEKFISDG
jgi:hypothetical protein